MKFSNVVVATASLVLIGFLLNAVLRVALLPVSSDSASELLAWIIAFLVTSLIVGYVFALKREEESRIKAVGSILVLSMVAALFYVIIWIANPFESPWFRDSLSNLFNSSGWTNYDWAAYSAFGVTAIILIMMVSSFIGLYIGSMRKK